MVLGEKRSQASVIVRRRYLVVLVVAGLLSLGCGDCGLVKAPTAGYSSIFLRSRVGFQGCLSPLVFGGGGDSGYVVSGSGSCRLVLASEADVGRLRWQRVCSLWVAALEGRCWSRHKVLPPI